LIEYSSISDSFNTIFNDFVFAYDIVMT